MTIERPMFPPRRDASPFRIVGGIDFAPSLEAQAAEPAENRSRRKRKPVEYRKGFPVIDSEGKDRQDLPRHRQAPRRGHPP
jgi:hypothetical protein